MMGVDGGYSGSGSGPGPSMVVESGHYGPQTSRPPTVISGNYGTLNGFHMQRAMQVPQDLDLATTR